MTLASGLGSQFTLAKETTYGTVVTPTKGYEFDSESFGLDQTFQDAIGLRANRMFMPSGRMRQTIRQAPGSIPMDVPTKGFGSIIDLMHGLVVAPVQQAATTAYLQTHLIGTSMPNKSATLQFNKPTSQAADTPFTYPGAVLTGASFSIDTAGILKANLTWDAQDERTPATTPSGPSLATAAYPTGVTSWVGTVGASITMAGSPVAVAKSVSLDWAQPYKTDRFFLGTTGLKLKPIPNGIQTTTGSLNLEWYDATAYAAFRAGTPVAIDFKFENDTIASTYKEMIEFTVSAAQPRGTSPQVGGPDVLDQTVPFTCGDDGTNPPLQIKYQSTDTTI